MKSFITILLLAAIFTVISSAQGKLPVIKSSNPYVSIKDGKQFRKDSWRLAPEANPDIYRANLVEGKPHKVTFISDIDSISFMVEECKTYDFIIRWDGKDCYTQILGQLFIPASVFDEAYRRSHDGKTFIQIPKVYELINVAIAVTSFGEKHKNFVYQNSPYYLNVREWFDPFKNHLLISKLDSILNSNSGYYATLKMNGNAFEFDKNGRIVRSTVYDRTGFRYERINTLLPYLDLLQSFANQSDFFSFYDQNTKTYSEQIIFYRDSVNIAEMQNWLEKNFPGSNSYDTYNIIFSPLVSYNQSTTWFESNGFRELQPHVNFPYQQALKKLLPLSREAELVFRGNIVFTEINHGYINPEAQKYANKVRKAVSNRDIWVDKSRSPNYYSGHAVFSEYMNWGLVSLRIVDYVPKHEQDKLIERVVRMMVQNRDFIKFEEFNSFLIDLYISRKAESTLADLYPRIIEWFAKNNWKSGGTGI